jgi:hypothetical protein
MADNLNLPSADAETTPTSSPQDAALGALAKDDDASAYIQARTGEADDEGEQPNGADRSNKIEQALEEARARSRQAREQEHQLDRGLEQAEAEWQAQQQQEQVQQQQVAQALAHHEARGRCMERAEQLKRSNPQLHKTISDNLTLLESVLDPDQAKVFEHALVYFPEAMFKLGANLSNDTIDGLGTMSDKLDMLRRHTPQELWQGINQGVQRYQLEQYVDQRIFQDRIEQGRRVTKAPPPIVPPRGTASVPRDMFRTAEKSDASDYIKMRRAQNARAERD